MICMRTKWLNKNVDISLLSSPIEKFFVTRGFKVLVETKSKEEYLITAVKRMGKRTLAVKVKVFGKPDDFIIEFASPDEASSLKFLGSFLQLIGFGGWYAYKLRSKELYDRLENEFWSFIDPVVSRLSGSASK
ncbi:hypothetical protein DRO34_01795 [Candidatus Bathyarchaeota archaeon]|nr:MAG: hypothetical protein DRO34_01795 [Candidatus Bathyarchaeota archaeon]